MDVHALDQIVDATKDVLKAALPDFNGRWYRVGDPNWDRRSYPMGIAEVTKSRVEIVGDSGRDAPRLQQRQVLILVECHAEEIADINAEMSARRIAIEAAMIPSKFPLPINDVELVDDTGIEAIKQTSNSVLCALGLSFVITFHTIEGRPYEIFDPENSSGEFFDE